jgi:hypothetical protein
LDSLKDLALGGIGERFWKLEGVLWSSKVSSPNRNEWRGIYRGPSKTSCYYAAYVIVGTSDSRTELPTSYVFAGREGFVGNYTGPPIEGLELPTIGRNF